MTLPQRPATAVPGFRVGLLGGSFNPAHEGHLHVSRMCLRQLRLDAVWWLVSPQNRLKPVEGMAPLAQRMAWARGVAAPDRRIEVLDIERDLRTQATVHTLSKLKERFPALSFVWLMGADNLLQFPKWYRWHAIAQAMPIAVYPRPGYSLKARRAPALGYFGRNVLRPEEAGFLADMSAPAIVVLNGPEHSASATEIRKKM